MWAPRVRIVLLSGCVALVAAAPAHAAPVYSSRLALGFANGVTADRAAQAVERDGGRVVRRLGALRGAVVRARGGLATDVLLRRLRADDRFRYAERDYL